MNQNQWQKDYIGRRDPKVIREENANRVFEQRMRKIYQKPAPEPKPVNYIEQEIKEQSKKYNMQEEEFVKMYGSKEIIGYELEIKKVFDFLKEKNVK